MSKLKPDVATASKVSVIQEWEQYKAHISAPVFKLIASANGKSPQEQLGTYQKAWDQACAWGVLDGVEDHPGMVVALVKMGDAYLACATSAGQASNASNNNAVFLQSMYRWKQYYSVAAMLYAAARVKAEEYKCSNIFDSESFERCMTNLINQFARRERLDIQMLKLNHAKYEQKLKVIRREVESKANHPDVVTNDYMIAKDLLAAITQSFKDIIVEMLSEAIATLGEPPCRYAVIGLGSMSRNEMGPYSDIELGVIIECGDERDREYFHKLICFLELYIISIGETELPMELGVQLNGGFGIDKMSNIPSRNAELLLGTAEELANKQVPVKAGGDPVHLNLLRSISLVMGDQKLVDYYKQRLGERLDRTIGDRDEKTIRQDRALSLLSDDVSRNSEFLPLLGKAKKEEQFNIKKELYRLPSNLANYLALYYGVEGQSSWDKLEALASKGLMTPDAHKNVVNLLNFATIMRVKTHCFYKHEKEDVYHKRLLNDEKGFKRPLVIYEITDEEQKRLELSYRVLLPIHRAINDFTDRKAPKDFRQLTLYEDSLYVRGQVSEKMIRFQEAAELYEQAVSLDPENSDIIISLGDGYYRVGRYDEALDCQYKALKIIDKFSISIGDFSASYYKIAVILKMKALYPQALEYCNKSLDLSVQKYGENHSITASLYEEIGTLFSIQEKFKEAMWYFTKALQLRLSVFGPKHVETAKSYMNLAAHSTSSQAISFAKKALEIRQKTLGEYHYDTAQSYNYLGVLSRRDGNYFESLYYYQKALQISEKIYGTEHAETALIYNNISEALIKQARLEEAKRYADKAIAIKQKSLGANHPSIAFTMHNKTSVMGMQAIINGDQEMGDIIKHAKQTEEIFKKVHGADHSTTRKAALSTFIAELMQKSNDGTAKYSEYKRMLDDLEDLHPGSKCRIMGFYVCVGIICSPLLLPLAILCLPCIIEYCCCEKEESDEQVLPHEKSALLDNTIGKQQNVRKEGHNNSVDTEILLEEGVVKDMQYVTGKGNGGFVRM